MALRSHRPKEAFEFKLQIEVNDIDEVTTYDIACEYMINLPSRFAQQFPDLLESIKKIRWGVPALHHSWSVKLISMAKPLSTTYWPELNQLGPHTLQMNLGHRQDTIIAHHGNWNHEKTSKIVFDLAEDIEDAKRNYVEKHFKLFPVLLQNLGKKLLVYTSTKQRKKAIFEKMLTDEENFKSTTYGSQEQDCEIPGLRNQNPRQSVRHKFCKAYLSDCLGPASFGGTLWSVFVALVTIFILQAWFAELAMADPVAAGTGRSPQNP
ncbi:hypothetical protein R3P38DRAFT_3374765 [Favolaschia claudopus]|uniref:Uncharacterized protein n=1 Tax=Favolaschia claudopus TaxID=2862362 RepID=A0AAV9ZLG9_9AGAR